MPIYPILFGIYPLLTLLGSNISEVDANVVWRPLWVSLLCVLVLWLAFHLVMRNIHRSALFTSIFALFFFFYGHAFIYLQKITILGVVVGQHQYLLPVVLLALTLVFWWAYRRPRNPASLASSLNLVSIFLLVYPLIQITPKIYNGWSERKVLSEKTGQLVHGYAPDIYYFILDAYARDDVLLDVFKHDNSSFTDGLKDMGFYVGRCSQSNYSRTALSLPSSLNMEYLDALGYGPKTQSAYPVPSVAGNAVPKFLDGMGYQIVAFENGFYVSRWKDADYFFNQSAVNDLNSFERLFVSVSAARIYPDLFSAPPEAQSDLEFRNRTLFTLEQFEETIPAIHSPKFVFAHLIIPHEPYVFGPNGEAVPQNQDANTAYVGQVKYINKRMNEILRDILANSPNPPVILVQADHGTGGRDVKMKILNAYYLPFGSDNLYPAITPVNSFRIIFNEYFGTDYKLLDDISLFSFSKSNFEYEEVPNSCQP